MIGIASDETVVGTAKAAIAAEGNCVEAALDEYFSQYMRTRSVDGATMQFTYRTLLAVADSASSLKLAKEKREYQPTAWIVVHADPTVMCLHDF